MRQSRVSRRSAGALPLALVALALAGATPARARAAGPGPVTYALSDPASEFTWGCFAPCKCPILGRSQLQGTFVLRFSHSDPLFDYYDVLDARFTVSDSTEALVIAGSGFYRRGGEVAESEQMALDLSFDGRPAQHFDSGLVPPRAQFPEIDARLSLHGEYCRDSLVVVDAKPLSGNAGVGAAPPAALTLMPNPTRAAAEIGFSLDRPEDVSLAIFDTAGRRLRTLIAGERFPAGTQRRKWDGRLESGAEAPAGFYVVKLELGGRQTCRGLVKLR
jgi:hypothetical protein